MFVSCSEDEINVQSKYSKGWEEIPGKYNGWLSYLNPSNSNNSNAIIQTLASGRVIGGHYLNSSISKIGNNYQIKFGQSDDIQIHIWTLKLIEANNTISLLMMVLPENGGGSLFMLVNSEKV